MGTMMKYTIERIRNHYHFTKDFYEFLDESVPNISKMFGDKFNIHNTVYESFALKGLVLICRRNGEIRGMMIASLFVSPFDSATIILQQQLFYVKPDSGRTAYHLFQEFLDIGKAKANHIITMLTSQTNIKPETLEKMGFKELETLYRLEV